MYGNGLASNASPSSAQPSEAYDNYQYDQEHALETLTEDPLDLTVVQEDSH